MDPTAVASAAEGVGELMGSVQPKVDTQGGALGKWLLLLAATLIGFIGLALQTLGYQMEEVRGRCRGVRCDVRFAAT